jgi:two-component sensor histidine kinase
MSLGIEKFFRTLDACIFILNDKGEIQYSSMQSRLLLGYADIVKFNFFDFISSDATELKKQFNALDAGESIELTCRLVKKGTKTFEISAYAWFSDEDEKQICVTFHVENFIHSLRKDLIQKTDQIELLSKSTTIRSGELSESIQEILQACSLATDAQRVNVWLLNHTTQTLNCLGSYDSQIDSLVSEKSLDTIQIPSYFDLFETEKIINVADTFNSPITKELKQDYLQPNDIQALMDVPLRIAGEIVGVICFENVGTTRIWTLQDLKFGLIAAQMVSLALESNQKKILQQQLQTSIKEKETLVKETYHRVKNNLTIINSLIHLQEQKVKDNYHLDLLTDLQNKIRSISNLHELLYKTEKFNSIPLKKYLEDLIHNIQFSLRNYDSGILLKLQFEDVEVDTSYAIPLGLIINEAVTNAYKHAFPDQMAGEITISLSQVGSQHVLKIEDNGIGFDIQNRSSSFGLDILEGLVEQIDGSLRYSSTQGFCVEVHF